MWRRVAGVAAEAYACASTTEEQVPLGERVAERWYQDHQLLEPDLVSTSEGKAGDHRGAASFRCDAADVPACAPVSLRHRRRGDGTDPRQPAGGGADPGQPQGVRAGLARRPA